MMGFLLVESGNFKGTMTGISIGTLTNAGIVTPTQKVWRSTQALGAIAYAYSFSMILIEIQVILSNQLRTRSIGLKMPFHTNPKQV